MGILSQTVVSWRKGILLINLKDKIYKNIDTLKYSGSEHGEDMNVFDDH